jgi:ankyrin repeat protein
MTRICSCCNNSECPADFETRCNHHFHQDCIWRASICLNQKTCPKCKTVISTSKNVEKLVREGKFEDIKSLSDGDLEELFGSSILSNDMDMRIASLIIEQVDKKKIDRYKGELLNFVCAFGDVEMFDALVGIGANVCKYMSSRNLSTALNEACKNGHLEIAEKLIQLGADIDSKDGYSNQNKMSLHFACIKGYIDVVEMLVHMGIDVNMHSKCRKQTALHYACCHGQLGTVKKLIQLGADVNICDCYRITPLHLACEHGHVDIVEELIKSGAKVNTGGDDKMMIPLHFCDRDHDQICELLIKADVNSLNSSCSSPLHLACKNGNIKIAKLLIESGAKILCFDSEKRTPLYYAQFYEWAEIVDLLNEYTFSSKYL